MVLICSWIEIVFGRSACNVRTNTVMGSVTTSATMNSACSMGLTVIPRTPLPVVELTTTGRPFWTSATNAPGCLMTTFVYPMEQKRKPIAKTRHAEVTDWIVWTTRETRRTFLGCWWWILSLRVLGYPMRAS